MASFDFGGDKTRMAGASYFIETSIKISVGDWIVIDDEMCLVKESFYKDGGYFVIIASRRDDNKSILIPNIRNDETAVSVLNELHSRLGGIAKPGVINDFYDAVVGLLTKYSKKFDYRQYHIQT